jgi:hypothetical protein
MSDYIDQPATDRLKPMMDCGHAANGWRTNPDGSRSPVCVICVTFGRGGSTIAAVAPSLEGRTARCYCGNEQPSSIALAFFEYLGPGTGNDQCATCHYAECVHHEINPATGRKSDRWDGHPYVQWIQDHDRYYCGHSGWD